MAGISAKPRTRMSARTASRARRHTRVRKKIVGTAERPRISVTRSAKNVFVQLVDDGSGRTLAWASTLEADVRGEQVRRKVGKAGK